MANRSILSLHDCQKEILSAYAMPINYSWALIGIPLGAFLPLIVWTWLIKVPLSIVSTLAVFILVPLVNVVIYLQYLLSTLSFPPASYIYDTLTMCKTTYSYIVLNIDTLIQRDHLLTSILLGCTICFGLVYSYIDSRNKHIYTEGNAMIQQTIDHNVKIFTPLRDTPLRVRSRSRNRLRLR
jgi:hypothetical protein